MIACENVETPIEKKPIKESEKAIIKPGPEKVMPKEEPVKKSMPVPEIEEVLNDDLDDAIGELEQLGQFFS